MGACMSSESATPLPSYTFNFGAHPTVVETELWQTCSDLIVDGPNHIRSLTEYKGCDQTIRQALSAPTEDNEAAALRAVERNVAKVHEFYTYSTELEKILPPLLTSICLNPESPPRQSNATVNRLAQIFQYAFHFDELKMASPSLQNDFSYYRRSLSRMRAGGSGGAGNRKPIVSEELANSISFYLAYPTPMMKVLIGAAAQMPDAPALVPSLAEIANVACSMALQGGVGEDMNLLLCLMTGCIVFIDHLSPAGAFHRKTPINMRGCVGVIRTHAGGSDLFLNSLRFSTLHLADESTPPTISKLFE